MEKEATQTTDLYELAAWAHTNRQRLITISVTVAALIIIFGGYYLYSNSREIAAGEALSSIKQPNTAAEAAQPKNPQPYLKVAEDYSGTGGGANALLIAAGMQFEMGKFADARASFEKFISQYSSNPLANQARLGVAACFEAEGNIAEASSRYEDMVKRHQADSTTPQARSALARLYVVQKKPELAMAQYEELVKANNSDTWTAEAGMQLQELLAVNPSLRKAPSTPAMPAVPTAPTAATNSSTVTVPPLK